MEKKQVKSTNATSSIKYSGSVTIKKLRNTKVVKTTKGHNSGTKKMIDFLANCLANKFNEALIPNYIRLFLKDENDTIVEVTTQAVVSEVKKEVDLTGTDTSSVTLSFLVPSNVLSESSYNLIRLYDNSEYLSTSQPMAEILLEEAQQVGVGVAFLIMWKLVLSNAPETSSTTNS